MEEPFLLIMAIIWLGVPILIVFILSRLLRHYPERRVILQWPGKEYHLYDRKRTGYLMTRHISARSPEDTPLFKEDDEDGLKIYPSGLKAFFATVKTGEVSKWTPHVSGKEVVATLRYQFVPWSQIDAIYPLEITDHGTSGISSRAFHLLGYAFRDGVSDPMFRLALQVETRDLRTAVLVLDDRKEEMFRLLADALDQVWLSLYHPDEYLTCTLWDKRFRVDSNDGDFHYYHVEYAKGDIFKPRGVRGRGENEVTGS